MVRKAYPFLNGIKKGVKVKEHAFATYFAEQASEKIQHQVLDAGAKFAAPLSNTLSKGGSVIFPHTYISKCGDQIAAAVHASLDCGADQVLALGVMHAMNQSLMEARTKELNGDDLSDEPSRGVLGPDFSTDPTWKLEFSLSHFKALWEAEIKRRGITHPPKLIECYPSLTNRNPEGLPGISELERIARDSAIVATDDMCHHGISYGVPHEEAIEIGKDAESFARDRIERGFEILRKRDYVSYFDFWMDPAAIGDPTDTSIVLRHLLGDVTYKILDLKIVDVTELFAGNTTPSWVAATLVEVAK